MADDTERVYTIPLGKVLLSPDNRRSMRAINMIREFARKHMKVQEIKIDQALSHEIWARGIRRPPRKVRVRMSKTEDGHVLVSPYSLGKEPAEPASPAVEEPGPEEATGGDAAEGGEPQPDAAVEAEAPGPGKPDAPKDAPKKPEPKKGTADPKAGKDAPKKPEPKKGTADPKAGKDAPKKPEPKKGTADPKPGKPKPKGDTQK
ncbi:MAG: 50S ribosomal protein L31e [Thaumarchaeota archaeon]|nr:50S ribosomal protein L31e [Nitrososphaerota archaeon]